MHLGMVQDPSHNIYPPKSRFLYWVSKRDALRPNQERSQKLHRKKALASVVFNSALKCFTITYLGDQICKVSLAKDLLFRQTERSGVLRA